MVYRQSIEKNLQFDHSWLFLKPEFPLVNDFWYAPRFSNSQLEDGLVLPPKPNAAILRASLSVSAGAFEDGAPAATKLFI